MFAKVRGLAPSCLFYSPWCPITRGFGVGGGEGQYLYVIIRYMAILVTPLSVCLHL